MNLQTSLTARASSFGGTRPRPLKRPHIVVLGNEG